MTPENQLAFNVTLGPSGILLGCSVGFYQALGVPVGARLTLNRLLGSVQPQTSFLSLANSTGSGFFTINGCLFEVTSRKGEVGHTELAFVPIEDDRIQGEALPSHLVKLGGQITPGFMIDLLMRLVPATNAIAFYAENKATGAFRYVDSQGYHRPAALSRVLLGNSTIYTKALDEGVPVVHTPIDFFQGNVLDGGSIFEYRAATGGKLPLASISLPFLMEDGGRALMVMENFESEAAFSDVIPRRLAEEIAASASATSCAPTEPATDAAEQIQALDSVLRELAKSGSAMPNLATIESQLRFLVGFEKSKLWLFNSGADSLIPYTSEVKQQPVEPLTLAQPLRADVVTVVSRGGVLDRFAPLLPPGYSTGVLIPIKNGTKPWVAIALANADSLAFQPYQVTAASIYQRALSNHHSLDEAKHNIEADQLMHNQKRNSQNNAIWDALLDGVLVTDAINRVQYANKSFPRLFGMADPNPDATIDSVASELQPRLANWKESIVAWSMSPDKIRPGETFSDKVKLANGRVISIQLSPVLWGNEFLGTVTVFHDVSYEFEFDRLKTDFITSISHELRTPLTSIQGYVDLLLMGVAGDLGDEQRGFMAIVKSNSERLNNLINDMLELTTIEAGKANLSIHPTDIFGLAQEVIARYRERSEKDNRMVELQIDAESEIPLVLADKERVRQILDNLISNAYSFVEADGKINISFKRSNGALQVNVSDTGVGISREKMDLIFDQFSWVDHPADQAGNGIGLGLPIVKQLVELHNGKIWVESSGVPGEGSTFSFTLPAQV